MNQDKISKWIRPIGIVLTAILGGVMLWRSWGRWPDIMVDFGQQLYLPWRLSQGESLYMDVYYIHGPLSQYFNAFVFRCFGVGLTQLVITNLLILVLIAGLLYNLLTIIGNDWSAAVSGVAFVTIFAFGQYTGIANYNYVCPYTHEATHGMLLSLGAITSFSVFQRHRSFSALAVTGFLTGMVFLTKAEIFLALFIALLSGLLLTVWFQVEELNKSLRIWGLFFIVAAIPPLISFILLTSKMPASEALWGTAGTWPYIFLHVKDGDIISQRYFLWQMGTLSIADSLRVLYSSLMWHLLIFGSIIFITWQVAYRNYYRFILSGLIVFIITGIIFWQWSRIDWIAIPRSWPVILMAVGGTLLYKVIRSFRNSRDIKLPVLQLTFVVFSFGLLLKMILHTRFYHYGFVLAMPATMTVITLMVGWLPDWFDQHKKAGIIVRATSITFLILIISAYVLKTDQIFNKKTYIVTNGVDRIITDWRGVYVEKLLAYLNKDLAPEQTLAVFPEGVMFNYLARLRNPMPYTNFMPTSFQRFTEDRVLGALKDKPPDYIILAHKDTSEFGPQFFGRDYGIHIFDWIIGNYNLVGHTGQMPLRSNQYGIALLKYVPQTD